MIESPVFFSGIGGSGMLPLASIVRASGTRVAGSDRSLDAGRTPLKFDYLRSLGIQLFPQDGSGLQEGMMLVTSAAVEDNVPDVVRARELGLQHLTRPQFLAQLLNDAHRSVAVGGTSGKSTVTGMIGWILQACHRQPTVMNGAVMRNFVTPSAPFASALVGDPELFISEVDESDGSISLYHPEIAVLTNVSLDHKELDELRSLFAGFLLSARKAVLNLDDPETRALAEAVPDKVVSYGFDAPKADLMGKDLRLLENGAEFALETEGERHTVRLGVPGRHNASNALAAIAATRALGLRVEEAVAALGRFEGLKRRLETVGEAGGVTVIDDFAHNPHKIDATLATLHAGDGGRLLILFQPHGFGPITKMGEQLADSFANGMAAEDKLYLPDPVYQGGTVARTRGSDWLADAVRAHQRHAQHIS